MTDISLDLPAILAAHALWARGEGGKRAYLSGADLSGAYLGGADLSRADLGGADLSGAYLRGAYLSGAYLRGADLRCADLGGADLSGADLPGADLRGADLRDAYLSGAYLSGADLGGADLSGAYLRGAYLSGGIKATSAPHRRATRADEYEFLLWHTDAGWRIRAGCRFFTPTEARAHWTRTRPTDTPLGAETDDILMMFEAHMHRHDAKQEASP